MTTVEHPQTYPTGRRLNLHNLGCKKCVVAVKALTVTGGLPKNNTRSFGDVSRTEVKLPEQQVVEEEDLSQPMRESTLQLSDYNPLPQNSKSNWRSSFKPTSPVEELYNRELSEGSESNNEEPVEMSTFLMQPLSQSSPPTSSSPLRRLSYDGVSMLPVMSSLVPEERVTRKVVESQGIKRYYIGEQEVSKDVFLNSL